MSLRKIATYFNQVTHKTAHVYRDAEWNEYRVKYYVNGIYQVSADYHCDTRKEAEQNAEYFVNKGE